MARWSIALLLAMAVAGASARGLMGPAPKVKLPVCHWDDTTKAYSAINIDQSGWNGHSKHASDCCWGSACTKPCDATKMNTDCSCKAGWTGALCTTDVDECATANPCTGVAICKNNVGAPATCECPAFYQLDEAKTGCVDIDECATANPCEASATCVNNVGGAATCSCATGQLNLAGTGCE